MLGLDCLRGLTASLVKQMFKMARDKKPTVIFVDEIDSLCGSRDVPSFLLLHS